MSHSTSCPCPRPLKLTTCLIATSDNQQKFPFHPSHPPPPTIAPQPPPHRAAASITGRRRCDASGARVCRLRCVVTARRATLQRWRGGLGEKGVSVVNWGWRATPVGGLVCSGFKFGVVRAEENQVRVGFSQFVVIRAQLNVERASPHHPPQDRGCVSATVASTQKDGSEPNLARIYTLAERT